MEEVESIFAWISGFLWSLFVRVGFCVGFACRERSSVWDGFVFVYCDRVCLRRFLA